MANDEHVAILEKGVAAWNAWRAEHPDIRPDLGGANFSGATLSGANLGGANLSGANLSEANLNGANLSGRAFRLPPCWRLTLRSLTSPAS